MKKEVITYHEISVEAKKDPANKPFLVLIEELDKKLSKIFSEYGEFLYYGGPIPKRSVRDKESIELDIWRHMSLRNFWVDSINKKSSK